MSDARRALAAPLKRAWTVKAHVTSADHLTAPPCLIAWRDGAVCGLDPLTGRRRWSYAWRSSACAIHGETVLAWVGDDELHVLDVHTGRLASVVHCAKTDFNVHAVVVRDVLLVLGRDRAYGGQRLTAVDLRRGRRLWSARHDFERSGWEAPLLAAGRDTVTINLGAEHEQARAAFDVRTGRELWRQEGEWDGRPELLGDVAIGPVGGVLLAQRLRSGKVLWRRDGVLTGQLYANRYYACGWRGDYRILDARTGRPLQRWDLRARLPKALRNHPPERLPILVSETHLFARTYQHGLLAFTRDEARYQGRYEVTGNLTFREGRLYVWESDTLTCLRPAGDG